MIRIRQFLAYYCIVVTTCLLLWSLFIYITPTSLILSALFVPCGLYFWLVAIRSSPSPDSPTTSPYFLVFLILVVLGSSAISALIFGYFVSRNEAATQIAVAKSASTCQSPSTENENVASLFDSSSENETTASPSSLTNNIKLITPISSTIDIYASSSLNGKILGHLQPGQHYLFLEHTHKYYLVFLPATEKYAQAIQGYVDTTLVKEVNY